LKPAISTKKSKFIDILHKKEFYLPGVQD